MRYTEMPYLEHWILGCFQQTRNEIQQVTAYSNVLMFQKWCPNRLGVTAHNLSTDNKNMAEVTTKVKTLIQTDLKFLRQRKQQNTLRWQHCIRVSMSWSVTRQPLWKGYWPSKHSAIFTTMYEGNDRSWNCSINWSRQRSTSSKLLLII